jgi:hypothetical protein
MLCLPLELQITETLTTISFATLTAVTMNCPGLHGVTYQKSALLWRIFFGVINDQMFTITGYGALEVGSVSGLR